VEWTAESIKLFLPNREAKYFSLKGWTGRSIGPLICPSGKSRGVAQIAMVITIRRPRESGDP
jgi:hypothetical protein